MVNNTANLSGSGVFDLEIWLGGVARDHGNLNRNTDQKNLPSNQGGRGKVCTVHCILDHKPLVWSQ